MEVFICEKKIKRVGRILSETKNVRIWKFSFAKKKVKIKESR